MRAMTVQPPRRFDPVADGNQGSQRASETHCSSSVARADLESVRLGPGHGATRCFRLIANHDAGDAITRKREAQVMEIHSGSEVRELAEQTRRRHRLGAS